MIYKKINMFFGDIFNSPNYSDFEIIFKSGNQTEKIYCHKIILDRIPKFRKKFNNFPPENNTYVITDYKVFMSMQSIIRFLYNGEEIDDQRQLTESILDSMLLSSFLEYDAYIKGYTNKVIDAITIKDLINILKVSYSNIRKYFFSEPSFYEKISQLSSDIDENLRNIIFNITEFELPLLLNTNNNKLINEYLKYKFNNSQIKTLKDNLNELNIC